MAVTALWAPNQGLVAQVETATFTIPSGAGNTYIATINGKSVTYTANATDGLTAAAAATGLFTLLQASRIPEFQEIDWTNPSSGVVVATASEPGTPFANVSGISAGLVFSTGNGLVNGISQAHTTANASPSDVNDAQNWLRINTTPTPPTKTRQLPQNGDDFVVANSSVPMLWNLDQLALIQAATYTRWQSMEGSIGLPENNPNGYTEWRATYFKFSGPTGSVPAGGLTMILGTGTEGNGPGRERYDLGSSPYTLTILAAGQPLDEYSVRILGVHTANTFTTLGVSLGVAMLPGEKANLVSSSVDGGATVGIGPEVTWTAASTLTVNGGGALLLSAPATVAASNGASLTFFKDGLTWAAITAQGGCSLDVRCGGIITALTLATGSFLDKANNFKVLTITDHTMDGDSCFINDPLNSITFTNAGTVRESVQQGPYRFTGPKTVKVT